MRKLFCEISPLTFKLSVWKCQLARHASDVFSGERIARERSAEPLPHLIYSSSSLIRRRLGNVDLQLQENKAVNLGIAAPKLSGLLVRPGETFSFWRTVGSNSAKNGYKEGLTISRGEPSSGVGGGMCQMTNMIHWLVLHSPLTITEHHHHDSLDLFPDFGRVIPFGTGTSIKYNYLDYRFRNDTEAVWQLVIYTDATHLHGELRSDRPTELSYHIHAEDEYFSREDGVVYRNGTVVRDSIDKRTGNRAASEVIKTNHARVMYDTAGLEIREE